MKKILFLGIVLVGFGSCVSNRQRSSITGRTDEVYFTPSDTRIKGYLSRKRSKPPTQEVSKSYTGSYADRLHHFGSGNSFRHNDYGPVLTPSLTYDDKSGWSFGYLVGDPYYHGNYYPNYHRRPSFVFTYNNQDYYSFDSQSSNRYNSNPFCYGYYGPYYNAYYNSQYKNCSFNKYHYSSRIGLIGISKPHNTPTSSTTTNSTTKQSENSSWWNNSSGSSSSGNRNTSGNTSSGTRRR